jgi:hypothetical protein
MRRPPRQAVLLVAHLLVAALPAAAQDPPPQPAEPEAEPATEAVERWAVQVDFGFNGSSGNTRLAVLTSGFQVRHLITDEFKLEWSALYRYGESEGSVVARNMKTVLSGDFGPDALLSPFFFGTVERDPFRRLRVRADGGGGAKVTFHSSRAGEASFSTALLYSHERFTPAEDGEALAARTDARWSMRARARRRLADRFRAEHTTFYQPVWDRVADYNVDALTRITAQLNDWLAIGLTHNYRFDSTPPPDVLRADQSIQVNLTVQF